MFNSRYIQNQLFALYLFGVDLLLTACLTQMVLRMCLHQILLSLQQIIAYNNPVD